ncbi:dTMP kinase [Anaerolineales bacterium]
MVFISFEGIDGSGKSTQAKRLYKDLLAAGYPVILTREPGGTAIGDQIRTILLDNFDNTNMNARTELLLFCASRAQLVAEWIQPQLKEGKLVLCDRYSDSTLAYQGYGHGLDIEALKTILQFATGGLKPALSFYLEIETEAGLRRRMQGRFQGEEWNRLDDMEIAFYQRVTQGYQDIIQEDAERFFKVDARPDEAQVYQQIKEKALAAIEAQGIKKTHED